MHKDGSVEPAPAYTPCAVALAPPHTLTEHMGYVDHACLWRECFSTRKALMHLLVYNICWCSFTAFTLFVLAACSRDKKMVLLPVTEGTLRHEGSLNA